VLSDRQIVLGRRGPDRVQIRVVGRLVLVQQRHHRHRPARAPPGADLAHRGVDVARRGDDHALEAVGMLAAEVGDVAVVGPGDADFERGVGDADEAGPGGRDEEMDVAPFRVHVGHAALRLVVLDAGQRLPGSHPGGVAAGEGVPRGRLAQHPPEELLAGCGRHGAREWSPAFPAGSARGRPRARQGAGESPDPHSGPAPRRKVRHGCRNRRRESRSSWNTSRGLTLLQVEAATLAHRRRGGSRRLREIAPFADPNCVTRLIGQTYAMKAPVFSCSPDVMQLIAFLETRAEEDVGDRVKPGHDEI